MQKQIKRFNHTIGTAWQIVRQLAEQICKIIREGLPMYSTFDLIEYQDKARGTASPKELFRLWDEVCRFYEKGFIGKYELDEMKESILPALHELCNLRKRINEHPNTHIFQP